MPHHLLVLDEDESFREELMQYLSGTLGYRVTALADGEAALEHGIKDAYDLSLISLHLSHLPGAETYMRLKRMHPDLQAVFFSDDRDVEMERDFLRFSLPPERVVRKPIADLGELTRLIISILGPPAP